MLVNICMKFHDGILNGFRVTERTRFCDRQTDGQTTRAKTICLQTLRGGGGGGGGRATEILKSNSVHSTDDVIRTCVRQSQIVTKTNDLSFSSKSVSEIDYFSNTL